MMFIDDTRHLMMHFGRLRKQVHELARKDKSLADTCTVLLTALHDAHHAMWKVHRIASDHEPYNDRDEQIWQKYYSA